MRENTDQNKPNTNTFHAVQTEVFEKEIHSREIVKYFYEKSFKFLQLSYEP